MRLSALLTITLTFAAAAVAALVAANFSVKLIEENSEIGVRQALDDAGMTWAEVEADGLQVTLAGIAPTEVILLNAITTAGTVVDTARVINSMEVEAQAAITPPHFSAEMLRNEAGVSVIGLVPASTDLEATIASFSAMVDEGNVVDLLQTADYPVPDGWQIAMDFAVGTMALMPRAKISVSAGRVEITANADSNDAKTEMEKTIRRNTPSGLKVTMDIAAPRPVITPFTLRFEKDADGARFDACSADTERARRAIVDAAVTAGATGEQRCTVGMGVPTPQWATAVSMAINAVNELSGGSVSFADADITLLAAAGTDQSVFDRVVGELETSLPDVFALNAKLPQIADPNAGPPEFTATLSPEGQVQLRGRMESAAARDLADSYAKARFGSGKVYTAARVTEDLPTAWSQRVLTGLEALSGLSNGAVRVTPETIAVTGNTGNPDASTEIATLLAGKLGDGADYDVNVTYQKKLDPVLGLPTPSECEAELATVQNVNKISFEPSSATIDESSLETMDDIASILERCGAIPLEIQGHTDSQGREIMNQELSQSRAESVLNELRARRVLTGSFTAKGYGETRPIQDNDTEAGREANRRIEFRLIRPDTVQEVGETTLESVSETGDTQGTDTSESQD